jgi:hypothetical protein
MDRDARTRRNELFLQRLLARRPQDRGHYEGLLQTPEAAVEGAVLEAIQPEVVDLRELALETIVSRERPVLFVKGGQLDTVEVTTLGNEARELVRKLNEASPNLLPLLPLIGRIDVLHLPFSFVGTGWLVDTDIVVTNRHVASLIARWDGRRYAFSTGVGGRALDPSFCNAHEYDDPPDESRSFKIREVLYIEPASGPHDIAFVRVERRSPGANPPFISVATADVADDDPVCVIGYPARAPRSVIPNQELMNELYRGRYDIKRAAPGLGLGTRNGFSEHDCTTLGGNSGSVVLDFRGSAVGLHFAGRYQEANYAVPASALREYIRRKRWNEPVRIEARSDQDPAAATSGQPAGSGHADRSGDGSNGGGSGGTVSFTIPLTISVALGTPTIGAAIQVFDNQNTLDIARVEAAVRKFWRDRPDGVVAARVGYFEEGDDIGERPCIAVSVLPKQWAAFESTGAREFQGVPLRYLPAGVDEQVAALPALEAVESIAYDDDARTSDNFSLSQVHETMHVRLHVGPEYSWDVLRAFISQADGHIVSAIYEFHAPHVKDALQQRLEQGASLTLVCDNTTFNAVRDEDEEFDRVEVFEEWAEQFDFKRVVAPEGSNGLIANSYHMKVTVRDDGAFWLSSGNWKMGSSQPPITQDQRDNSATEDLPGNREWHVVVSNQKLATRFRSHILQDYERSRELGGQHVPQRLLEEQVFVDVPIEVLDETMVLERRPPSRLLEPKDIQRVVKVRPLLTPDQEGAVYSEAVLNLIQSAQDSLLFQIPYIAMPSDPDDDRGYIDELIAALTRKLKTLDDARLILRSGGSRYSSPTHAAWYLKSKGVDIAQRVRVLENHHTKGMIVDGRRVLVGSHNWSKPGVTLNRDASLLFHDEEVAEYFTEAFEIDWSRANRVQPRRFRPTEAVVLEAVGDAPPPGFRRVPLSDWLRDD